MKRAILLYRHETPRILRVIERLRGHFGERRIVAAQGILPESNDDDVVVALLGDTTTDEHDNGCLPLHDIAQLEASGLEAVFARDGTIVPVLLDGAVMPAHTEFPPSIQKLAFRHALPLRLDSELDRDLGRLVEDLEVHIQQAPGRVFPWDFWMGPIGIICSVLFAPFLWLWLIDVNHWNYGYQTAQQYWQARLSLTMIGPGLLGASLLLVGVAISYRRFRHHTIQRSEHFRKGTGKVPESDGLAVCAALPLAMASIGWGWWGGIPAILCVVIALARRAFGFSQHLVWRRVLVALLIASCGVAWAVWRAMVVGQFEIAIDCYERGIVAETAGQSAQAEQLFRAGIDAFPRCGHSYHGLGLVSARSGDWEAAYREFSNAIDRYPTKPRGYLDPSRDMVAKAYTSRARVAEELGRDAQADLDRKMADDLTPFLDGLFNVRWW